MYFNCGLQTNIPPKKCKLLFTNSQNFTKQNLNKHTRNKQLHLHNNNLNIARKSKVSQQFIQAIMDIIVQNRKSGIGAEQNEAETLLKQDKKAAIQKSAYHVSQTESENAPDSSLPLPFKALRLSLYIAHKALNIVYVPLFIYRVFEKSKRCPRTEDELLMFPVSELTRRIRRREISCEKVIRSYISRIQEVNPLLNAVIDERFDEAIEDAKLVDQLVSSKEFLSNEESIMHKYPLLGVPLTVKGSIAVKGLRYTSGMATRRDLIAENDAVTVDLARKAGAIPLLVSNVPELCMNWESSNKLIGTTNNPYDSTRSCGGSSGGEASLMGSGASLIGIGSDIAGSLRLPAHYCGVWGHKPTPGTVSYEGHYPGCSSHDKWEAVFTLGPMARYAGDLRTLFGVIAKPDDRSRLGLSEKINVKTIKVYFADMKDFFWATPSEPCASALQNVIKHFQTTCDCPPEKVDFHLFQYATDLATLILMDIDDVDHIFDGNGNGFYSELLRFATCRSKHSLSTISYGFLRKVNARIQEKHKQTFRNSLAALAREFEKTLGKDGVFILPTFPVQAIKHGDWLRTAFGSGYMSIFNVLGFPVTNCPVGVTKEGLPVGVQVVGLPYSDKLTLSVAEHIEEAFGGWRTPNSED